MKFIQSENRKRVALLRWNIGFLCLEGFTRRVCLTVFCKGQLWWLSLTGPLLCSTAIVYWVHQHSQLLLVQLADSKHPIFHAFAHITPNAPSGRLRTGLTSREVMEPHWHYDTKIIFSPQLNFKPLYILLLPPVFLSNAQLSAPFVSSTAPVSPLIPQIEAVVCLCPPVSAAVSFAVPRFPVASGCSIVALTTSMVEKQSTVFTFKQQIWESNATPATLIL